MPKPQKEGRCCRRCGFCGGKWDAAEEDVAQKWIQEDSRHRFCGRHCRCPYFCYRRCGIRFSYFAFVGIVVVRFIIYAFEPMIFPSNNPFDKFKVAECKVIESKLVNASDQLLKCQWCDYEKKHCWTTYPCLRIFVTFSSEEFNVTALLRASEVEARQELQCSYEPSECDQMQVHLEAEVQLYDQRWGMPGQQYPCLYNPKNHIFVIRERKLPTGYVRNWASLVFFIVLSAFGILLQFLFCGCKYIWSAHAPESIRIEVADKSQGQAMVQHA